jgi:hypothetical protein
MEQASGLIMPSLRSSIRKRLEAEEAEQDNPVEAAKESNPIADNAVEQAAQEAIQTKLAEQPEPVVEPRQPRYEEEDDDDNEDAVHELELRAADASAQLQGHKFGSRGYADAIANNLRQEDSPRRERGSPSVMAPVSRESPSWSSGRTTPSKTELTAEEVAFCHEQTRLGYPGYDLETYRANKKRMNEMKASGVIQS